MDVIVVERVQNTKPSLCSVLRGGVKNIAGLRDGRQTINQGIQDLGELICVNIFKGSEVVGGRDETLKRNR